MTHQELRLECLRLAEAGRQSWDAEVVVRIARIYSDYVLGTRDAEIVGAAREFAEKVR